MEEPISVDDCTTSGDSKVNENSTSTGDLQEDIYTTSGNSKVNENSTSTGDLREDIYTTSGNSKVNENHTSTGDLQEDIYTTGGSVGPPRLWALDPLFRCGVKLFISEVLCLPQVLGFPRVFNLYNHAVTRFDIAGCIVSVDRKETFIKFKVDDGTGVIGCCVWLKTKEFDTRALEHKHGELVSVSGKLTEFREEREIIVDRIAHETDLNYEPFHWMQIMKCRPLYQQPRVLPDDLKN